MLPGSEEVQTRLLGQDRHLDCVLDALMLTGSLASSRIGRDISNCEDSELHETSSLFSTLDFNDFLCTERTGEAHSLFLNYPDVVHVPHGSRAQQPHRGFCVALRPLRVSNVMTSQDTAWKRLPDGRAADSPCRSRLTRSLRWLPASPGRTARGWGDSRGGSGALWVSGTFVQYAQPLASRSRTSWSRPTRGETHCEAGVEP